jgi:hypothetical protein
VSAVKKMSSTDDTPVTHAAERFQKLLLDHTEVGLSSTLLSFFKDLSIV